MRGARGETRERVAQALHSVNRDHDSRYGTDSENKKREGEQSGGDVRSWKRRAHLVEIPNVRFE